MRYVLKLVLSLAVLLASLVMCEYGYSDNANDASGLAYTSGLSPHSRGLPSVWKGRDVSDLVAALGEPDMVLETSVRGIVIHSAPYAVSYVYFPSAGYNCYQAFVVAHETGEILAYHCR
jgi:hypothetical protein